MSYKSLVAAAAIIVATPAFAQGHGGGHGGPPGAGGSPAGGMSQGPMNASPTGIMNANPNSVLSTGTTTAPTSTMTTTTNTGTNASTNSQATVHSQGPAHASPTGIAHANENSVLARGAVAADAPVDGPCGGWLLEHLGREFTLLTFGRVLDEATAASLASLPIPLRVVQVGGTGGVRDVDGLAASRYDGRDGTCYLVRPDQHVCARWRTFDRAKVEAALARATRNRNVPYFKM